MHLRTAYKYEYYTSLHSIEECLSYNEVNTLSIQRVTEDNRQEPEGLCECGPLYVLECTEMTVSSATCSNIDAY